jgi:hypothetical protein
MPWWQSVNNNALDWYVYSLGLLPILSFFEALGTVQFTLNSLFKGTCKMKTTENKGQSGSSKTFSPLDYYYLKV